MSTSSANKRIAVNTLFLYLRSIIVLLISLYTSRVLLSTLGVEDFGIYNLVGGVVGLFSMISSTLQAASQRFITYALGSGDLQELKKIFSTSITLHVLLGLLLSLILEFVGLWMIDTQLDIPADRIVAARYVFQFSLLTFFFSFITVPYSALIIAHERMSVYAYLNIFSSVLKLLIVFLLVISGYDRLIFYGVLHFLIIFLLWLFYLYYAYSHFEEVRDSKVSIERSIFKKMFSYSGWNFIGSSALVLRNQGVDVLLNTFFGVTVNAAKGIASQVQAAIHLFVGSFTVAINPQLTASVALKDNERTNNLIFHGSRLSFFLMMFISVPFIISADDVLNLWLVSTPEYAVEFVRLTTLLILCDTISRLLKNGILAHGDIRNFQLAAGGLKLLALPLSYIVLKLGGNVYASYIICIVIDSISLFIELYFANTRLGLSIKGFVVKVVFPCWSSFLIALFVLFLFDRNVSSNLFIVVPVGLLITSIVCLAFMDRKERLLIWNPFKKMLFKYVV